MHVRPSAVRKRVHDAVVKRGGGSEAAFGSSLDVDEETEAKADLSRTKLCI